MALVFFDGFEAYANQGEYPEATVPRWYDTFSTATGGRNGGRRAVWFNGGAPRLRLAPSDEYVVGFAWYQEGIASNSDRYMYDFREGLDGSTGHVQLSTGDGSAAIPRVTRGYSTVLGTCAMPALLANTWYHFQMRVLVHDSAGEVEVRVNSQTVFSQTGIDTRNGGTGVIDNVSLRSDFTGYHDDLWVDDSTFLGDCVVEAVRPTGAGNSTQFTPSTGSNWQNVDDTNPDGDSTYNSSATVDHTDTFACNNLVTTAGTVHGLRVYMRGRKADVGPRAVRSIIRTDGANFEGTERYLSDSYLGFVDTHLVNPDTSAAWTISEVNAMELGYTVEL